MTTIRKDSKIKLSYFAGGGPREMEVDILSLRPLVVHVADAEFARLRRDVTAQTFVDLRDARLDDTLMTARVEKLEEGGNVRLKRLDENENRQYIRITAWLDFESGVLVPGEEEDILFRPEDIDLGDPALSVSQLDPQALARAEEAGASVLYLMRAVQAIDTKLDQLLALTRHLVERSEPGRLQRQKVSLSGSGIRFSSSEPFDAGTLLKVRFRLLLKRMYDVSAIAEVVRTEELPGRDADGQLRYGVACRFDRIRSEDRERIVAFALHRQREAIRRLNDAVEGF